MKPQPRKTKLSRIVIMGLIALLIAAGISLIGNGLWIKAKAQLAQVLLDQAFERVQNTPGSQSHLIGNKARPWYWADITPLARLSAPRLNKSQIILSDANAESLAFGPGHLPNTPLPGQAGTSVLAAHRDTHFNWIKDLKPGDKLNIENADGTTVSYSVKNARIVRYDNSGIDAHSHATLLALSTCYPFNAKTQGPMRYIVEAEMTPVTTTMLDGQ